MSEEIEWGAEIPVNGKRPEWLGDDRFQWRWHLAPTLWSNPGFNAPVCWSGVTTIRLPADHPYYTATEKGFKYWPGGVDAPADWDGGELLLDGLGYPTDPIDDRQWSRNTGCLRRIIGYRTRQPDTNRPSDELVARMVVLVSNMALDHYDLPESAATEARAIKAELDLVDPVKASWDAAFKEYGIEAGCPRQHFLAELAKRGLKIVDATP